MLEKGINREVYRNKQSDKGSNINHPDDQWVKHWEEKVHGPIAAECSRSQCLLSDSYFASYANDSEKVTLRVKYYDIKL